MSSVEAVHSQVIFFFYDNIQLFLSFLLNFYFTFFICYCFGTEIFLPKIKSIKLLLLLLLLLVVVVLLYKGLSPGAKNALQNMIISLLTRVRLIRE